MSGVGCFLNARPCNRYRAILECQRVCMHCTPPNPTQHSRRLSCFLQTHPQNWRVDRTPTTLTAVVANAGIAIQVMLVM